MVPQSTQLGLSYLHLKFYFFKAHVIGLIRAIKVFFEGRSNTNQPFQMIIHITPFDSHILFHIHQYICNKWDLW